MESLINRIIETEEFKELTNIGLNYLDISLKFQIAVGVIFIIFFCSANCRDFYKLTQIK